MEEARENLLEKAFNHKPHDLKISKCARDAAVCGL